MPIDPKELDGIIWVVLNESKVSARIKRMERSEYEARESAHVGLKVKIEEEVKANRGFISPEYGISTEVRVGYEWGIGNASRREGLVLSSHDIVCSIRLTPKTYRLRFYFETKAFGRFSVQKIEIHSAEGKLMGK